MNFAIDARSWNRTSDLPHLPYGAPTPELSRLEQGFTCGIRLWEWTFPSQVRHPAKAPFKSADGVPTSSTTLRNGPHHHQSCRTDELSVSGPTARHVRGTSRTGEIRTHGGLLLGRVQAGSLRPLGHRSMITERTGFEPVGARRPTHSPSAHVRPLRHLSIRKTRDSNPRTLSRLLFSRQAH